MNSAQLDPLDGPVRRRLTSELDGQLGRAEAAFLRHAGIAQAGGPSATAARPSRPAAQPSRHGRFMRFGGWTLSFVGTALAASIAALWAAPAIFHDANTNTGRTIEQPSTTARLQQEPMIHYVQDRTWDGGTIVVNDDEDGGTPHPARRYVRERIERTRWYDPEQKAWAETTVPHQDEAIVPVDTY